MRWITEFAFIDDNDALHISVPRMLDKMGAPDTPENRDKLTAMAAEILAEMLKDTKSVININE